jgi:hypothetical protein
LPVWVGSNRYGGANPQRLSRLFEYAFGERGPYRNNFSTEQVLQVHALLISTSACPAYLQSSKKESGLMPILLWLLGVPITVIVILYLFHVV